SCATDPTATRLTRAATGPDGPTPVALMPVTPRRSWLFVPGADEAAHAAAARSGADVIVLELEDFTPPELRPKARALSGKAFDLWRRAGAVAGVRVNPLETCGRDDLAAIARADVVMMSKVAAPEQV